MEKLNITKVEVAGELPSGCPWCPFDKCNGTMDPCIVFGCTKSGYGYRPEGCRLVNVYGKEIQK